MPELQRFTTAAALQLPVEALELPNPAAWIVEHHRFPSEPLVPKRDLGTLSTLIEEATAQFAPFQTNADAYLAPRLHRALPLTRKEATDRNLWAWLGIREYPNYVAHRWAASRNDGRRALERYSGNKVRQTFARLWWAAELTCDENNGYDLTEQLFSLPGAQDVHEAIFGRAFCGHRPAVQAFVEVVAEAPPRIMRRTAREFSNLLTTVVLEALSADDLAALLKSLRDGVVRELER